MDDPLRTEKTNPEETSLEGSAPDYATRKIEPDELLAAIEKDAPPTSDAATVVLPPTEDPAAAASVPEILEAASPVMALPDPAPVPPAPMPPAAPPKKDNSSMAIIIAIAVVALVCICACTVVALTTIIMIPNL